MPGLEETVDAALTRVCDCYEAALQTDDVETLNSLFLDSPHSIRFGLAEDLYGYAAIAEFRRSKLGSGGVSRHVLRCEIFLLNDMVAVVSTEDERESHRKRAVLPKYGFRPQPAGGLLQPILDSHPISDHINGAPTKG
jgi:Protein of unknown function (DUF3225)